MTHQPPDHLIDSWSDEELLAQYRYIAAELAEAPSFHKQGDNRPGDVLLEEIRRRGLPVPQEPSAASPGRESQEPEST